MLGARAPLGPISFISMQFSGKSLLNNRFLPISGIGAPLPPGNPGTATEDYKNFKQSLVLLFGIVLILHFKKIEITHGGPLSFCLSLQEYNHFILSKSYS